MKQLLIDRNKWCRGKINNNHGTALLDDGGMMCCLGFYCKQIDGMEDKDIHEIAVPAQIGKTLVEKLSILVDDEYEEENNDFSDTAININDNMSISEEDRENRLKEHFASNGIEIKFTGDLPANYKGKQ